MSGSPPTPFLLTRSTPWTPAFQSTTGDASQGTDGQAVGVYWFVGHMLHLTWYWTFGAGVTHGAGELLCPLPNGYTLADVDTDAMLELPGEGGGKFMPCVTQGPIGGEDDTPKTSFVSVSGSDLLLFMYDGDANPIYPDDATTMSVQLSLPMREPALPG